MKGRLKHIVIVVAILSVFCTVVVNQVWSSRESRNVESAAPVDEWLPEGYETFDVIEYSGDLAPPTSRRSSDRLLDDILDGLDSESHE